MVRLPNPLIVLLCWLIISGSASANVFPRITAGDSHTVALKTDGTVWAWGKNNSGQLGNGSNANSSMPVQVTGINNVIAITAGYAHTVAIKSDGTVWAWGLNSSGQLGTGDSNDHSTPVQVTGLNEVIAVVAGYGHTLALKANGTVWAWGLNNKGQLGNNSTSNSNTPVQVSNLASGVIAISGSRGLHNMALKNDGTVWTWGSNDYGQIGNGGATPYNTAPISVSSGAIAISASALSSIVLKSDYTVWAWGDNAFGQCGLDPYYDPTIFYPTQIAGIANAIAISSGDNQTMSLLADGTAVALGRNDYGQLGNNPGAPSYSPVSVLNLNGIVSIASGANHTMAIKDNGTFWGWGLNDNGQLGISTTDNMGFPAVSPMGSLITPQVAAGYKHTVALKNDGTVWAWGLNDHGQLGNGSGNSSVPVPINSISGIVSVAAGYKHGVALKSDGSVWSWGANNRGQLGNGSTNESNTPVKVNNLSGITAIASSRGNHVLALKNDGTVWAWGANNSGQLGNNSAPTDSTIPVQVNNITGISSISAGPNHSVVLKTDDTVWAWGDNAFGQLGQDPLTMPTRNIPIQIPSIVQPVAVDAGDYHTVALKNDGTVWGIGLNTNGQLGDGSSTTTFTPVQVSSLNGTRIISAGELYSSAIKADGTVWGWGANGNGQLGNNATADSHSPVQANLSSKASTMSAGSGHTIAAATDGTVWGWGLNDSGQLGNGSLNGAIIPVNISDISLNIYTPNTVATPAGGTYASAQTVTLTSNGSIAIYYTIDGTTPTYPVTGTTQQYTSPIPINSSTALKFFAVDIANNIEAVKTQAYVIALPPITTASPAGGVYTSSQSVSLSSNEPGVIYYTTDGSTPTYPVSGNTQIYSAPITININTTLHYFARNNNGIQESVQSLTYTINTLPVTTATPAGGTYTTQQNVTLSSNKPGTIYFTVDGSTPSYPITGTTQTYSGPIAISSNIILNFFTRDIDGNQEAVQTQTYTMNIPPVTTATPAGGSYTSAQTVTLSSNKPGTIYYTDDGSMPTYPSSGTTKEYSNAIIISSSTILRYFTRDVDGNQESVQTQTYTVNIPPVTTAEPQGGTYPSGQTVTLTANKSGNIYYTLNGSDPTYPVTGTTQTYSGPITLSYTTTIKFFARDTDGNQEAIQTQDYTILQNLTVTVAGGSSSRVHSTPLPDIDCSGTCSQDYTSGTVVQLTAAPAATDVFSGWSGGCTGTGTCSITMNSANAITATFAPKTVIETAPKVAAGHYHSLALTSDGTVWAWGQNNVGQLGDDSATNSNVPVQVDTTSGLEGVVEIAAGLGHSVALKSDGTVWAWGDNAYGQIGTGAPNIGLQYYSPVQVSGISGVTKIAAGEYHTLALKNDGTVWAWGRNNLGQLGLGDSTDRSAPVQLTGIDGITAISAKGNFSIALRSSGEVAAWGHNGYGQLGNQTYVNSESPVAVQSLTGVIAIATGYNHAAALASNGSVMAWGENIAGGLGDGTDQTSNIPVAVSSLNDAVSISAGNRFSVALKSNGTVSSWGWNNWGQLGNSSNDDSWTPTLVAGISGIAAVSSGINHTIAIRNDGSIFSWGANVYGGLGNGSNTDSNTPVAVSPPINLGASPPSTTANPTGGLYVSVQTVTLTANEPSTIFYTIDGTTPTSPASGTTLAYSTPITINSSTTLKYFAVSQSSALSENIKTMNYTINLIPITTASPSGGTYNTAQAVTLSSNKPGTIYFTIDGTDPTYPVSGSTQTYSSPIPISTNTTLKFFARDTDGYQGTVQTQIYTMNIPPVTTASPGGGTYTTVQTVALSSSEAGTIFFTTDGSTPTYPVSGATQVYSSPISINANTTLKFFARDNDGNLEAVNTQAYIMNIPPVTTANPAGGTYTAAQTVSLTSNEPGGAIFYTIDGSTPTYPVSGSTLTYSSPITINSNTTLKFFGRDIDGNLESVKTELFTINTPPETTATPIGGTYPPGQTISLSSSIAGSVIYYTTDGSTPTYPTTGTTQVYSGPITLNSTTTLKYFARDLSGNKEAVKTQTYTISTLPYTTATPAGGTYTAVQTVTLSANMPATIYFTVDGTDPTYPASGSTQTYSGPITISADSTLKYFAVDATENREGIKSQTYIITLPVLYELSVTVQGGNGSVVSSTPSPDISCSGVCSQNYQSGTEVTLTPNVSPSDIFVGWSGACTGTSTCIIAMNDVQSVTANFASIGAISTAPKVAGGYWHTVALKGDGTVWSWGNNMDGQLGIGSYSAEMSPQKVTAIQGITAIAAGDYHSLALRNDGTVWAWGYNNYGQLGNGTDQQASNTPVKVKNLTGIIAIAAGAGHSVALKNDGTVWTWGNNVDSQLGNNSMAKSNTPVQVSGISDASAIAAGWLHTLALKNDGTVWAWGYNAYGQLGNALGTQVYWPVQVSGLSGITAIAAGGYHSVSLKNDTTVWSWGKNNEGQLGDASTIQRAYPVQASEIYNITSIAAGGNYTIALNTYGEILIWGNDSYYSHPFMGSVDSSTPVLVNGVANNAQIAAGYYHTLAMNNDGSLSSWGFNNSGQLGNGSTGLSTAPLPVVGLNVSAAACFAKIDSACFGSIAEAYLAPPSAGTATILAQSRTFNESLDFSRDTNITISGGYNETFSSDTGNSELKGRSLAVISGSVAIGRNVTLTIF
ncbi:chitobiase/beta-hexosaminidase C-terminal domain-containing protein [Geobacter sp. OR-1]|uniref:RCC1 domain-containing protein n=1 Tax=Geobacter sp. OR-1 TaxID=1266765 RepID=UPI002351E9D3|nr:chitobiase/beta-hexosaminidase C-terminal domain-containing protein [Geobacter sp. OR-1]